MRAIQQTQFGGPEVLELVDLPVPEPGEREVLIRVSRAGMNFADTHQRSNDYLAAQQLPLVPGGEVAGVREDSGQRVVALSGTGGYAEYATAPEALTFPIPDGVDDGTALALLIQGLTAWHLYRTCGRVGPGESVVVVSGAGGVGSLAVQLGRPMQAARVIATASTQAKRDLCLELGADVAVDGDADGLKERLVEANGGRAGGRRRLRDGRGSRVRRLPRCAGAVRAPRDLRDRLEQGQRGPHAQAHGPLARRGRVLADALHRASGHGRRGAGRPLRARGA